MFPPPLINPYGAMLGHYTGIWLIFVVFAVVMAIVTKTPVRRFFFWLPAVSWVAMLMGVLKTPRGLLYAPWGMRILVALAFGSFIHLISLFASGGWRRHPQ